MFYHLLIHIFRKMPEETNQSFLRWGVVCFLFGAALWMWMVSADHDPVLLPATVWTTRAVLTIAFLVALAVRFRVSIRARQRRRIASNCARCFTPLSHHADGRWCLHCGYKA